MHCGSLWPAMCSALARSRFTLILLALVCVLIVCSRAVYVCEDTACTAVSIVARGDVSRAWACILLALVRCMSPLFMFSVCLRAVSCFRHKDLERRQVRVYLRPRACRCLPRPSPLSPLRPGPRTCPCVPERVHSRRRVDTVPPRPHRSHVPERTGKLWIRDGGIRGAVPMFCIRL